MRVDWLDCLALCSTVIHGTALAQPSGEMDLWDAAEDLANEFRELV